MFNEMGNQPTLLVIIHFTKSSLPRVWRLLFGITLLCLTGRSFGLDQAKLKFYSIMVGLYFGLSIDYASLLWVEFGSFINHSKMTIEVSSTPF